MKTHHVLDSSSSSASAHNLRNTFWPRVELWAADSECYHQSHQNINCRRPPRPIQPFTSHWSFYLPYLSYDVKKVDLSCQQKVLSHHSHQLKEVFVVSEPTHQEKYLSEISILCHHQMDFHSTKPYNYSVLSVVSFLKSLHVWRNYDITVVPHLGYNLAPCWYIWAPRRSPSPFAQLTSQYH